MAITTTSAVRQLSDGSGIGTVMGQSATDPVGFFGATPAAQASGPTQAVVPVAGAAALTHYTSTQSPSSVVTITVAEQSATVTGVLATDMVIVNKPTAQAGLGLCMGRVSAANTIKLTYANVSAATLTPTGSEAYIVTTIPANLQVSQALTPASVAANSVVEQQFTLTGTAATVATGMLVQVNKATTQAGLGVLSSRVISNNVIGVTFINPTAAAITPTAAETYEILGINGLAAASQVIQFGVNVGTLSSVATITTSEQSITEAGIAATDVCIGMSKPTTQAGLILGAGRVSAASTAKVVFGNPTAGTLTPTASEVYGVTVFRPSPGAPATIYTASIAPTSVAANTSAEQTYTVTGLVSGQPVAVSPQLNVSLSGGVGIAGVRASATNTLAVTWINTTAAAIVPPTGTWTVMQFNQTTPTAGNFVQLLVSPLQTAGVNLMNAVRAALVAMGLIAGA